MALRIERTRLATMVSILGAILLLAAGLKYLFLPQFDGWVQAGLGLGVVCIAGGVMLAPDRLRQAIAGRQVRYGSNAVLMSAAFAGILVVANLLAYNNPQRIDLTEDKQFSLAPETELLLAELSQPVQLLGFYTPDRSQSRENLRPLLDEYALRSDGLVSYQFIDPRANPVAADQYGITRDASMAVVLGESSQVIDFPSEREISSAIVGLANPESRVVYFLTGHGERELEATDQSGLSQLRAALESKDYLVSAWSLLAEGAVPADARALVIAGALSPLSEAEIQMLRDFAAAGGSLVVLHEPTVMTDVDQEQDTLAAYLEEDWGVVLRDNLVVDLNSAIPLAGISFNYAPHPITDRMGGLASYYPTARSLQIGDDPAPGSVSVTPLVFTGDNSWGETDLRLVVEESVIEFDEQTDEQGPLALAAAAEDSSTGARVVVVGDSDFAANAEFLSLGNGDIVVNSVDWASRQEALISLTPKAQTQRQVIPASREAVVLLVLTAVVLIPGAVIVLGVVVWWTRRKQT